MKTKYPVVLLSCLFMANLSLAALVTDDNAADFFTHAGLKTTYDFEVLTGFPLANADGIPFSGDDFSYIGAFNGISFNAASFESSQAISGSQTMTGVDGTFDAATIGFSSLSGQRVIGFGFYGLDLTEDESIRVEVDFANAGLQVFDVMLLGGTAFVPTYFGAYDSDDTINSLTLFGTDTLGTNRAWSIDDLTIVTAPAEVPVPAGFGLLASALLGLSIFRHRKTA